jgi:hypothetical protein
MPGDLSTGGTITAVAGDRAAQRLFEFVEVSQPEEVVAGGICFGPIGTDAN